MITMGDNELIDKGTTSVWFGKDTIRNIKKLGWEQRGPGDILNDALELAVQFREVQEKQRKKVRELELEVHRLRELYALSDS